MTVSIVAVAEATQETLAEVLAWEDTDMETKVAACTAINSLLRRLLIADGESGLP